MAPSTSVSGEAGAAAPPSDGRLWPMRSEDRNGGWDEYGFTPSGFDASAGFYNWLLPTNEVTPGVLRTTGQDSSSSSISTRT